MITKISLHNWKSFESASLLIDQITFLIGTNSSGKSNIVDALIFVSRLSSGERLADVCKSIRGGIDHIIRRGCDTSKIEITFIEANVTYRYTLSFSVEKAEAFVTSESLDMSSRDEKWINLYDTVSTPQDRESNLIKALFDKDRPGQRKGIKLRRDLPILSQVQGQNVLKRIKDGAKAALKTFSSIYVLEPSPNRMRDFVQLSETLYNDGSNVAGVIAALPEEDANNFEKRLTGYVSTLPERDIRRIWTERVGRFKDTAMLYCQEDWGDGDHIMEIDARSMSDGTLRFIAIIVALLTRPSDSLIVIEEIDNGLHPSRTGELVHALSDIATKGDFDVLCTTHNPVLIDALSSELLNSVSCVNREGEFGTSAIFRLTNRPDYLSQLAQYSPGKMMTYNLLSAK